MVQLRNASGGRDHYPQKNSDLNKILPWGGLINMDSATITVPVRLAALAALLFLLAACSGDSRDTAVADEQLRQQNLLLQQRLAQTVDSFEEQCIAAGFVAERYAGGKPVVAAMASHPEGECLDCHEAHGKPDCADCHDMTREAVLAASQQTDLASVVEPSFAQPTDVPRVGDIDGLTGASGDYYYGAASYLDASYLASRVNGMKTVYHWEAMADGELEGIASLESACQLPERSLVNPPYPDDGKVYRLGSTRNQLGAKLVSTVNRVRDEATGVWIYKPNIATFGYGMLEDDGKFFVTLNIGKNNSCYNAISSGDMRFSYYEYDPGQAQKHQRNRGARIIGRVDYHRTALKAADWKTELPGLGVGTLFAPEDVDWDQVAVCSLVVAVVGIIPLG